MSQAFSLADDRNGPLREFLTGQLNPDWDLEYASWRDAVSDLVAFNARTAREVLSSLDELFAHAKDEASATELVHEIGFIGFFPEKMGPSVLGWLHDLRSELARDLGESQNRRTASE